MNLQPLRIEAGWQVTYNQFYEVDPIPGHESYFEGSSLLMLRNNARLKIIDLQWRPELDLNGEYQLQVLNFVENFNPITNEFDTEPNWEHPVLNFATKSRLVLVEKLEDLLRTLPVFEDPRMIERRGVIDELSESYRLKIVENGISTDCINDILENGSAQLQVYILNHKDLTREILLKFAENGVTKKVKNQAKQKLTSKRFRV
ncbi:MAG: hypothetical protein ABJN73_12635 [Nonlabens ulvanivorans]|uniref:hypothetical protein n=1 Tax=Nonlabens ulvanivorans TaxID=906888 RepID=UPI0032664E02